jgi:hypothetical protein
LALQRLAASRKFRTWLNIKAHEIKTQETIEQAVERQMVPENLKVEVRDEQSGRWMEIE